MSRKRTARLRLAAAIVALVPACANLRPEDRPSQKPDTSAETEKLAESKRPFVVGALLYLPNRIIDLFDLVRFGVDVGPGFGVEAQVTEWAQAGAMARTSAGVGLQTLRHLPVKAATETYAAVGPLAASPGIGLTWYRNDWDVRAELHVAIVGAHVAVNPAEILDFLGGFVGLDPMDDDF